MATLEPGLRPGRFAFNRADRTIREMHTIGILIVAGLITGGLVLIGEAVMRELVHPRPGRI